MKKARKDPAFTRLYIIRHGQTDWNKKGIIQAGTENSLNAEGIHQAQALSARMADTYPVDTIISSPAIRARETASVINQIYHADIEILNDLIEIDFGDLKNHIIEKLPETQQEYIDQFNHFLTANREDGTPRTPKWREQYPDRKKDWHFYRIYFRNTQGEKGRSCHPRNFYQMPDDLPFRRTAAQLYALLDR